MSLIEPSGLIIRKRYPAAPVTGPQVKVTELPAVSGPFAAMFRHTGPTKTGGGKEGGGVGLGGVYEQPSTLQPGPRFVHCGKTQRAPLSVTSCPVCGITAQTYPA